MSRKFQVFEESTRRQVMGRRVLNNDTFWTNAHYSTLGRTPTSNCANTLQIQMKMALVLLLNHAYSTSQYFPNSKLILKKRCRLSLLICPQRRHYCHWINGFTMLQDTFQKELCYQTYYFYHSIETFLGMAIQDRKPNAALYC